MGTVAAGVWLTQRNTLTFRLMLWISPGMYMLALCCCLNEQNGGTANVKSTLFWAGLSAVSNIANFMIAGRMFGREMSSLSKKFEELAEGQCDLTARATADSKDEIGHLAESINAFIARVEETVRVVIRSTQAVAKSSSQLSGSVTTMEQTVDSQKQRTMEIATAMEEMSCTVSSISEHSRESAELAQSSAKEAREGGAVVEMAGKIVQTFANSMGEVCERMTALGKRSVEIGKIVVVIDDIADQTNLLALNAAIEAARAGEQGRGFAVVADEVRKLSERTAKATREIGEMIAAVQKELEESVLDIQGSTSQVRECSSATAEAGLRLNHLIEDAGREADSVMEIANSAQQQEEAVKMVNTRISEISALSQSSSQEAQSSAETCRELDACARELQETVSKFKVGGLENETAERFMPIPVARPSANWSQTRPY
jgi:methyl-accepting chemotaxis protein